MWRHVTSRIALSFPLFANLKHERPTRCIFLRIWMAAGKILQFPPYWCAPPCTGHHLSKHCSKRILETPFPSCWHYCIPPFSSLSSSLRHLGFFFCCTCSQKNGWQCRCEPLPMWYTYDVWQYWLSKSHTICPNNALCCTNCGRLSSVITAQWHHFQNPTPLRFLTFNHVCSAQSSPSPVHSLCLYVVPVMWEPLRPCVLSHVTVILQRRRPCHVLMYNLVMWVCTQTTKPNISATLTLPLSRQTVMTFITCLSGHHCGMTGFNLLSTSQSAFLSWPSYSGMFIQVCACLLVVCSEHHQVIGRPNILYVKQLFNASSQQKQRG